MQLFVTLVVSTNSDFMAFDVGSVFVPQTLEQTELFYVS
jgi:hypothetical protein